MPVGYQLESSTDNGASWEVLVEDTGSAEPRARLTSLAPRKVYLFRASIHSAALRGDAGPPSAAFTPGAPLLGPPAHHSSAASNGSSFTLSATT